MVQYKAPIRSHALGRAMFGNTGGRSTGPSQGSSANHYMGQIDPAFEEHSELSIITINSTAAHIDGYMREVELQTYV